MKYSIKRQFYRVKTIRESGLGMNPILESETGVTFSLYDSSAKYLMGQALSNLPITIKSLRNQMHW